MCNSLRESSHPKERGAVRTAMLSYLTTTTFTSQPECHFSPLTEVILVRPTLYSPSCPLILCCQDEEKVRAVVTRLLGELPREIE